MVTKPKPKLKVFQARSGFYDTVVAAPSRAAALRAWGVHQDLFAGGVAGPATDSRAIEAALAHPNVPLRRAIGSDDDYAVQPKSLPDVPDAPKSGVGAPKRKAAQPKPPPDRTALDEAETALRWLDETRKQEEATQRTEQAQLDRKIADAQSAYVQSRQSATAALVKARLAYRKAGGRD